MEFDLAVIALLVAGYALVAARLDRFSIGPALAFLAIGIVLSDDVLGPIAIEPQAEPVRALAEVTLTLLLFADASTIRGSALRHDAAPVARLLTIGLLLTIAFGTVVALLLFPGTPLGIALLVGATLAPTDAALGLPVITNPVVPPRIRHLLNIESGLNDGIATPFVILAVALSTAESPGTSGWLLDAVIATAIGVAIGLLLGLTGGSLLGRADRARWTSTVSRQLFVLALALGCYLVSVSLGGNGFIAAFVGGLAFGRGTGWREESAVRFTEVQGSLLAIGVWVAFGLTLAGRLLTDFWDPAAIVYAVLSLTVIRMLPVAIALTGLRYTTPTILFVGWFGPRGLASIVFLVLGIGGLTEAGVATGPLVPTVAWTVVLSVVLHGLTAGPLAARYGRRMAGVGDEAPELAHAEAPAPKRVSFGGAGRSGPAA